MTVYYDKNNNYISLNKSLELLKKNVYRYNIKIYSGILFDIPSRFDIPSGVISNNVNYAIRIFYDQNEIEIEFIDYVIYGKDIRVIYKDTYDNAYIFSSIPDDIGCMLVDNILKVIEDKIEQPLPNEMWDHYDAWYNNQYRIYRLTVP